MPKQYIVTIDGRRMKVTSEQALTAEQAHALARRGIGAALPSIDIPGEPSLTQGPHPEGGIEPMAQDTRQEMPWLARAPLEVGLPMAAGLAAGAISGPAAPATVPLAAGGAQVLGSEINKRVLADVLGFAPPKPSFSNEPGREAALQFGAGVASEAIPGAAMTGIRRLMTGPTPPAASRTLEAFKETGVEPKMTDLATSRFPATMESFARQTLTGAPFIDKAIRTQAEHLTKASDEFLSKLGPILGQSEQATGRGVENAITEGLQRGQGIENQMWRDFRGLAQQVQGTPIEIVDWARDVLGRGQQGLKTTQDSQSIRLAREILAKATKGGTVQSVPLDQLDLWRQDIGRTLSKPELISGFDQGRLRHLYGNLLQDVETSIQYTGSQQLMDAWKDVRGFSKQLIDLYRNSAVADVVNMTPEEIVRHLNGTGGVTDLRQWKSAILGKIDPRMGPSPQQTEAWDMTRRHIFESVLGETTHGPGKAVDVAPRGSSATSMINGRQLRIATNRMGDDTLDELLNSGERKMLANIGIVADAINKGGRVGAVPYTSITAQNSGIQDLIAAIGGLLGAGAGGNATTIAAGLAASAMVPPTIAKLLTSPKAVEVFASPGFGRLAMEFGQRKLSREGAATVIRMVGLAQEADPETTVAPAE